MILDAFTKKITRRKLISEEWHEKLTTNRELKPNGYQKGFVCCMHTAIPIWTWHIAWQKFQKIHRISMSNRCVGHLFGTTLLHDRSDHATIPLRNLLWQRSLLNTEWDDLPIYYSSGIRARSGANYVILS